MGGQIVDASIVAAPRQRMTDEERSIVRDGGIPGTWAAKLARLAHKDRDARWTRKRGRRKKGLDGKLMAEIATPILGYKSHIGIGQRHGFIRTWQASDSVRYDGRELPGLIDSTNAGGSIWADAACRSQNNRRRSCAPVTCRKSTSADHRASRRQPNVSAQRPGSDSPTSPSTSNASSTGKPDPSQRDRSRPKGRHHSTGLTPTPKRPAQSPKDANVIIHAHECE